MLSEYLLIGEITKPQGITGEVKVQPHTGDPGRFSHLTKVYMESGAGYEEKPITGARVGGGDVFLTFPGVTDRNMAETLRGKKLYVDRAHAVVLSEDENFICDLIGCEAEDTNGNVIGKLVDISSPVPVTCMCLKPGKAAC